MLVGLRTAFNLIRIVPPLLNSLVPMTTGITSELMPWSEEFGGKELPVVTA